MEDNRMQCIFCGAGKVSSYFIKETDAGNYPIVHCESCLSAYVWPRPGRAEMDAYYSSAEYVHADLESLENPNAGYYPSSMDDARKMISECRKLAGGGLFLDIGAGFGEFSKVAGEQGFEVTACEPSPTSREQFYKMTGFEALPDVVDKDYADINRGRFDVVLLSQVLEHISDPEEVVENIHALLKPGGIAAIGVPHFGSLVSRIQGRGDMYISPPEHLNFFSCKGLSAIFERSRFTVEKVETVSKIPRNKIEAKVKLPVVAQLAWMLPYGLLKSSEWFGKGMIINAYFRKH